MGDIGDVRVSLSLQLPAADTIPDGSAMGLDAIAREGGVPYSGTNCRNVSNGGDLEAEDPVRRSGDATELAASCPSVPSSAEDSKFQLTHGSTTYHAAVKLNGREDDLAWNTSISCPSIRESQEGEVGARQPSEFCNDRPASGFSSSFPSVSIPADARPDGDGSGTQVSASFPVVAPPHEPPVDGQRVGPSLHRTEEVSRFSSVNIEGGNNATTWLRVPQARGKAVVRRGRPRPWSAESREEMCKRVKTDELYGDASPSTELTVLNAPPPFSQVAVEKLANDDAAHDATVLEPALLARANAAAFPPSTSAREQSHVPVTEHFVDRRAETPVKAPERVPTVTRCGGITLNGNQCTHNVKDGSGFCVKHTKTDMEHSRRADAEGSGTAYRGVPYYKQPDIIVFRCRGKTLNGHQCTHNVKDGGVYCLKHGEQGWGPPPRRIEEGVSYQTHPPSFGHDVPAHTPSQLQVQEQAPIIGPSSPQDDGEDGIRCIGRTRRNEIQCTFKAKSGSLFCERHARQYREKGSLDYDVTYEAPSSSSPTASLSLRRRRSQEVTSVADLSSSATRERRSLSRAKELFTDILNAGSFRGEVVSTDGKDLVGWICEEATKDAVSGEMLLGFLAEEKERLREVLIENRKDLAIVKPPHFWQTKYSPDLPRPYLDVADDPKVCSKDALPKSSLSDAHESFAQTTRQGSESARDVLTCALCAKKFLEMPALGKHWKEDHKKEAFLFQKGLACSECGQEYTNKGGLLRHWKSTHPTLLVGNYSLVVCMSCDAKFKDFNVLWMHVEEQHALDFSSAEFAQHVRKGVLGAGNSVKCLSCGEDFDTHSEFCNHNESAHGGLSSSDVNADGASPVPGSSSSRFITNGNNATPSRFKCRFCGQKFNLLPDLGRHHQAEHGTRPKNKLSTNVEGGDTKLQVKRTPLPNPESANSPPGKMLPLAEVFASGSVAEQGEHRSPVECPALAPALQPQALNFRHLKTIARERRNKEEQIADVPLVPSCAQPPVPPPAPPAPVLAPKKRRRRRKKQESLPNDNMVPVKKRLGRPPKKMVEHIQQEGSGFNGHPAALRAVQEGVKAVSKMPLQRATNTNGLPTSAEKVINTTGWPTSAEILDAARVACCKESWYRELAKKHSYVHPNLHLQAMSLFVVMRPDIQWLAETFLCPNQCLPFHVMEPAAPTLEVDMAGFSEALFKAEAGPRSPETVNIKDILRGKRLVLNEDLSNGLEPVPIPCVIDEEVLKPCSCAQCKENAANPSSDVSEPWKCFCYTNRRLLDPSLGLDTESSKLGCGCGEGKCDSSQCDHVLMFDLDNEHALDKSGVAMKGRFPYDEHGRIILEEGCLVYECNSSCSCREDCPNRVLQKGVRVRLEVFKSRHKGWAVRAAEPIRSGTFVCEYIGEVVNDREANRRGVRYDSEGCSYLYDIDAHLDLVVSRAGAKPFVIDATNHGNVARFINHSCAPNLINYEVLVESMDCQLAHIGFFARRDIGAGEELAYDYRYKLLPGKGTTCHCGAPTCRGRLY